MKKFIPYEKLSKQRKRELDLKKRGTWGEINPLTRRTQNTKAYQRAEEKKKTRQGLTEQSEPAGLFIFQICLYNR